MNKITSVLFAISVVFQFNVLAGEDIREGVGGNCKTLLNNHISVVDESENLISFLSSKKIEDITQFEVATLQRNLTQRLASLKKTMEAFSIECSNPLLVDGLAIYDFLSLGKVALNDTKLRRMIYSFTNYPKYELTDLRKMYAYFTATKFVKTYKAQIHIQNKSLDENMEIPEKLMIGDDIEGGVFLAPSDIALNNLNSIVADGAKGWGYLSDRLKWRNGRLKDNEVVLGKLKETLRPLDLIFEKRKFTLSNYTIPGHWGHVGVWLGSKEELVQMGIWDKDYFSPFRQAVLEGKNIVEVRKKGMEFEALEHFINLDEIAVTRIKNAQMNAEEIFRNLSNQVDTTYDFSFNAQTPDKTTCAELIAYSYGDIQWPELKTFLQVTLRPDDIAALSLQENSAEEFILYIKGNKKGEASIMNIEDWNNLFKDRKPLSSSLVQTLSVPAM